MQWQVAPCSDYQKAMKDFPNRWPAETRAVHGNLATLLQALERGTQPEQLKLLGFVHGDYPLGMLSIDETGHEKAGKPKAIRLYVYPSLPERTLYVMLLGDKARQREDVALCKRFVTEKQRSLGATPPTPPSSSSK